MKGNEIIEALDILEKLDFFGGQRAGRELWSEKPIDVQDKDIKRFSEDIAFLKGFINRQKEEVAELQSELIITKNNFDNAKDRCDEAVKIGQKMNEKLIEVCKKLQTAKTEAYKEFAERVKGIAGIYQKDTYVIGVDEFDNLLEEMESERK